MNLEVDVFLSLSLHHFYSLQIANSNGVHSSHQLIGNESPLSIFLVYTDILHSILGPQCVTRIYHQLNPWFK